MKHNLITTLAIRYDEDIHYTFVQDAIKDYDNLNWLVGDKPSEVEINTWILEEDTKSMMSIIRESRGEKLKETDWRFRSDLTPSDAWIIYCKELRDLPGDESKYSLNDNGDIFIDWPIKPTGSN